MLVAQVVGCDRERRLITEVPVDGEDAPDCRSYDAQRTASTTMSASCSGGSEMVPGNSVPCP